MELTPQIARTIAFRIVRKGYDPLEVDTFREQAASAIEEAQNQATAMEARARAAVAKLNELSHGAGSASASGGTPTGTPAPAPAPAPAAAPTAAPARAEAPRSSEPVVSDDDAKTISQALILAQRTAETTVGEARERAERILADAQSSAEEQLDAARGEASRLLDEAREQARKQVEVERVAAESEVQSLLARRDFLLGDVEHLEAHLGSERDRVRAAADALIELSERSQAGLAEARRPLLSASAAPELDSENTEHEQAPGDAAGRGQGFGSAEPPFGSGGEAAGR